MEFDPQKIWEEWGWDAWVWGAEGPRTNTTFLKVEISKSRNFIPEIAGIPSPMTALHALWDATHKIS